MIKWWAAAAFVIVAGATSTVYWGQRESQSQRRQASSLASRVKAERAKLAFVSAETKPGASEPEASPEPRSSAPRVDIPPRPLRRAPVTPLTEDRPVASNASEAGTVSSKRNPEKEFHLRREGSELLDVVGSVRRQGHRYEFVPADGGPPMILLENQILQRIASSASQAGRASPLSRWKVSGTVTEFERANYLLVRRAIELK